METVTGGTQNGSKNGSVANAAGNYSFSMSVTDGTLSTSAQASLQYKYGFYFGTTAKDGTSQPITDADILGLSEELRDDFHKSFNNFGGGAKRLVFSFPTSFGTPSFTINGLANTAFTKVRAASNFTNASGATYQADVWVSNNVYNSPLDSVILS